MKNKHSKFFYSLFLLLSIKSFAQNYLIKGNVSTDTEPVRYASVTFIDEYDSTRKYSTLTDTLGNYRLSIITKVEENKPIYPSSFELEQNYPNPFSTETAIIYKLNEPQNVYITIYNILGQEVKRFAIGVQDIGLHSIAWSGTNNLGNKVSSGVYFYQMQSGKETVVKKMIFGIGLQSIPITSSNFISNLVVKKYNKINFIKAGKFKVQLMNNENTIPQILDKEFYDVIVQSDTVINFTTKRASNDYDLCYMKIANGNWELFLNNIMGTNPKNITNWVEEDSSPAWSPDGKSIAFQKFETTGAHLFLYDTEKDTQIDLTHDFSFESSQPQWLPNSSKIVYTFHRIGEKRFTYIIDSNGANNHKLLNFTSGIFFYNDSYNFIYKPSGVYDSTDYCVYKADIYNTIFVDFIINLKNIGKNYVDVYDFDPVKNEILILADPTVGILNLLVTYNIDSKKIDTVSVADSGWVYAGPKFSNDYSKIAFRETNTDSNSNINRLSVIEAGKKTVLFELSEPRQSIDFHPLAFSADDKYLAFSINVYEEGEYVWWDSYLHIIDLETKEVTYIDMGKNSKWNPLKTY